MTTQTPSELHTELVGFAAEIYKETLASSLAWLFQGGEIPGIEMLTPKQLRDFFESTDPNYWTQLAQSNPQEAQSQLQQWAKAAPSPDPNAPTPAGPPLAGGDMRLQIRNRQSMGPGELLKW